MERQRGSVTAELAVVLPAFVVVAVLCVWAVTAVAVHVRCLDAARAGARALARGESRAAVLESVEAADPDGARVRTLRVGDDLVAVEVVVRVALPGPWTVGSPAVAVGGRAVAVDEEGTSPGGAPW